MYKRGGSGTAVHFENGMIYGCIKRIGRVGIGFGKGCKQT